MDKLRAMEAFVRIVDRGSLTAAAESLRTSLPSVVRTLASLEAALDTRLINRTTRRIALTDEGRVYYARCQRVLADIDEAEAALSARRIVPKGRLRLTAPVTFGRMHVAPVVTDFIGRHEGVQVELILLDRVVDLVEEGIDIGVRIGHLPDSALKALTVGHVRWVLCASPAYLRRAGVPRTLEALARHDCIAFTATTPVADRWTFSAAGRRERTVSMRPRLAVNTGQAAIEAAVAGVGILRALSYQVAPFVAARKLQIVLASFEKEAVPVNLVQLPGLRTRAAEAFVELAAPRLRERLGAH